MSANVNAWKTDKYVLSGGEVADDLNLSCSMKDALFRHSACLCGAAGGGGWNPANTPLFTLKLFCGNVCWDVFKLTELKNLQLLDHGSVLSFYGVASRLTD